MLDMPNTLLFNNFDAFINTCHCWMTFRVGCFLSVHIFVDHYVISLTLKESQVLVHRFLFCLPTLISVKKI